MQEKITLSRVLLVFALFALMCTGPFASPMESVEAAPMKVVLPGDVVISEFRVRGPNGGNDEFIELYNPKSTSADISGLTIRASSGAGVTSLKATIPPSTTLLPGQHYLLINSNTSNGPYRG